MFFMFQGLSYTTQTLECTDQSLICTTQALKRKNYIGL